MTDNPNQLHHDIQIIPLIYEDDIKLHWYKLQFFDMFDDTENIIMDIDQYIINDISEMIDYPVSPGSIISYRKWWGAQTSIINGGWYKFYGKSVNKIYHYFNKNRLFWQNFYYDKKIVEQKGFGEQHFVLNSCLHHRYSVNCMPSSWVSRYYIDPNNIKMEDTYNEYLKVSGDFLKMDDEWSEDLKILHFVSENNSPENFNA
jgi:hypothetical protein